LGTFKIFTVSVRYLWLSVNTDGKSIRALPIYYVLLYRQVIQSYPGVRTNRANVAKPILLVSIFLK
jgi:hypothetical protein